MTVSDLKAKALRRKAMDGAMMQQPAAQLRENRAQAAKPDAAIAARRKGPGFWKDTP